MCGSHGSLPTSSAPTWNHWIPVWSSATWLIISFTNSTASERKVFNCERLVSRPWSHFISRLSIIVPVRWTKFRIGMLLTVTVSKTCEVVIKQFVALTPLIRWKCSLECSPESKQLGRITRSLHILAVCIRDTRNDLRILQKVNYHFSIRNSILSVLYSLFTPPPPPFPSKTMSSTQTNIPLSDRKERCYW